MPPRSASALPLLGLLIVAAAGLAVRAESPPPPPEIQAILDRSRQGIPPTPEEQQKLRVWMMSGTRRADPAYHPGEDSPNAAATGIPDDVRDILARVRAGYRPTADEQARLQAWAAALKGKKGQLMGELRQSEQILRQAIPATPGPRGPRRSPFTEGVVRLDIHQHSHSTGKDSSADLSIDGGITIPVVFNVRELPSLKPGEHALSVAFMSSGMVGGPAVRHDPPKGGVHTQGHEQTPSRTVDSKSDTQIEAGPHGAVVFRGELFVDPARPRPYLTLTMGLSGQLHGESDTTSGGKQHHDAWDARSAAATILPVTWDGLAPGIPWSAGVFTADGLPGVAPVTPPATNPALLAGVPPELKDVLAGSRFDILGDAVRRGLERGEPFEAGGTFSYRMDRKEPGKTTTIESQVRVTFAIQPPESELVIRPDDEPAWRRWLPLPWINGEEEARAFGVRPRDPSLAVTLRVAFTAPGRKCRLDLNLRDVGEMPGLATNYPQDDAPKKSLIFLPDQDGLEIDADRQHARTRDEVNSIAFKIVAQDSGGYGKVAARCEPLGLSAQNRATGEPFVTVPRDSNDNHVADQWEEDRGLGLGHPTTWDEDAQPAGQRRAGDGYTLYEEYRGFVVLEDAGSKKKTFVRTDPNKKDLFIYDRDRLIKTYYEPSNAQAAGLELHYIDPSLMCYDAAREASGLKGAAGPEHRWLNFHSLPDQRYARQYAIVALIDNALSEPDPDHPGQMRCYEGGAESYGVPDAYAQPLKRFAELRVNVTCLRQHIVSLARQVGLTLTPTVEQQLHANNLTSAVIHELGHHIGIPHHRPRPGTAYPANSSSWDWGVWGCAMRYPHSYLDGQNLKAGSWPAQTRYCREGDSGKYPPGPTVAPEPDPCFPRIDVKSDP